MFTHLLLPTDGSPASEQAIRKCMTLAKETGARVTGFHAAPDFHVLTYRTGMLEQTREHYRNDCEEHAKKYLGAVQAAAREAGVQCDVAFALHDHPYEAIIEAANEHQCDLIVMASHGRKGIQGLLLGSETQKVLTHCRIPVLIYR